jgi:hypothetical protein
MWREDSIGDYFSRLGKVKSVSEIGESAYQVVGHQENRIPGKR